MSRAKLVPITILIILLAVEITIMISALIRQDLVTISIFTIIIVITATTIMTVQCDDTWDFPDESGH